MFLLFPSSLYFTLQFGPLRISRAVDFLIPSSLILFFLLKDYLGINGVTKILSVSVFIFSNFVGFSRGVWLALAMTFFFYLVCQTSLRGVKLRRVQLVRVLLATSAILLGFYFSGFLDLVRDRILDFDLKSTSVGGRFDAYIDMLTYSFSNPGVLLFGSGLGSNLAGMQIPASSSPSFFLSFLYINGLPFFISLLFGYLYLCYIHFIDFKRYADLGSLFALLNLFCHFIILNIFPSVNHYPIFGYLAFISSINISERQRK